MLRKILVLSYDFRYPLRVSLYTYIALHTLGTRRWDGDPGCHHPDVSISPCSGVGIWGRHRWYQSGLTLGKTTCPIGSTRMFFF